MPEFILNRNYTLRSTKGHVINFKKNEPTFVPPVMVPEVVALGAESVDGPVDVLGDENAPAPELTLEQREAALLAAFEKMVAANRREDFTAQGTPHPKALSRQVGFTVEKREVESAWQKHLDAKAADQ